MCIQHTETPLLFFHIEQPMYWPILKKHFQKQLNKTNSILLNESAKYWHKQKYLIQLYLISYHK